MADYRNKIPIFIINLKRSTDRRSYISAHVKEHNLKAEFISGVDGNLLTKEEIEEVYSKNGAIKAKAVGRELTKGEIGCCLSHRKIYQKMVDENIENAIIFEDDINIEKEFYEFLKFYKNLPKNCEVLLFYYKLTSDLIRLWFKQRLSENIVVGRTHILVWSTSGYYLNLNGAKRLLQYTHTITEPIDHYTGNPEVVKVYITTKKIITHNDCLQQSTAISGRRTKVLAKHIVYLMNYPSLFRILKMIRSFRVMRFIRFIRTHYE